MARDIDSRDVPGVEQPRKDHARGEREVETESRERLPVTGRGYVYCLSRSEIKTMEEIGRFRTVDERDLVEYRYRQNQQHQREDLKSLQDQGLVQRRTVWVGRPGERLSVVVLTKRGNAFLENRLDAPSKQKMFSGFVKPAEVRHDAAIYRMFQAEAAHIERAGGRVKRIVLDYELKQRVYQPLAKARATLKPSSPEYQRRQAEIARDNRLKVVQGKILLPDLRIEFENAAGERVHVDLELATHHYRGSSMRAKAEAGFKMYAPQSAAAGLSAAVDPELAAQIFSF